MAQTPPLTMDQAQETLQRYGIQSPTMAQPIPQTPTQSAVPGLNESDVPPPLSDVVNDWIMRNVIGSATMSGEMTGILTGATTGAKAFQDIPGTRFLPRQAQAAGMFTFGAAGAVMGDNLKNLFTGQGDILDSINEGLKSGLWFGMGETVVKGVTLAGSAINNIRKGVQPSPEQMAVFASALPWASAILISFDNEPKDICEMIIGVSITNGCFARGPIAVLVVTVTS